MHLSPWLLIITFLAPCISAFYPYPHHKSDKGKARARRFYPWADKNGVGTDDPVIPTLTIKKSRPNRRELNARANKYPVVPATPPSMKNSMAVNEDGQDYSYFATLKFGSAGTPLYMLVDTGAANTWVMGSDCTTSACKAHNTFGKEDSSTLEVTTNPWSVSYGTGIVTGVVANDTVSLAGFDLELGFGLASTTSDDFNQYPMDGILGLGRPGSNHLGVPTVMETLDNANLLKANLFGVHLQRNKDGATDGEVNFGALDTSKFTGNIDYTNSVSGDGLWEIPIDDAGVDGNAAGIKGRTAILDTGTSYVLMPPGDAKKLHALIPGSQPDGNENWKIPCSSTVPVQFKFSGKFYSVSHKDYVGTPDPDNQLCESNIIGHQPFGPSQWLLGDVFLKNVYTVFDFDKDRIGFGTNDGTSAPSSTVADSSQSTSISPASASKPPSSPSISSSGNGNTSPSLSGQILPVGSSATATSPSSATGTASGTSSGSATGTAAAESTTSSSSSPGLGSAGISLRPSGSFTTLIGVTCMVFALFSWT